MARLKYHSYLDTIAQMVINPKDRNDLLTMPTRVTEGKE